jgi:hypothetical protein
MSCWLGETCVDKPSFIGGGRPRAASTSGTELVDDLDKLPIEVCDSGL